MCNFDLDTEYYNSRLSSIYYAISNTSLTITAILFLPLVYLILKKSQKLGKYKYYMLIHTVVSFVMTFFVWLIKPVAIFQKYGIAICGPVTKLESRELSFSFGVVTLSCWVNVSISFSISIIYRAFAPFPGKLQKLCDNSIGYIIFIIIAVLYFHTTVVIPLAFCYTSESTTIQFIQEYFPEMALFQSRNTYFQIPPTKLVEYFCLNIIICYSAYYFFGGLLYGIFILNIIKYTKIASSKELVRLQMMLFKTITFQGIIEVILVITPAYAMALAFYFQSRHSSEIAIAMATGGSFQAWLNYICVMYNIVPYRNTIKKWLQLLVFNGNRSHTNVHPNHVVPRNST
ncbi:hypothetical protein FO519_007447 [Halicephalobus sp. NKZ332]|nr:hypothetical protein FO519_007447 [Halicephalobus sp. NKZ332]